MAVTMSDETNRVEREEEWKWLSYLETESQDAIDKMTTRGQATRMPVCFGGEPGTQKTQVIGSGTDGG